MGPELSVVVPLHNEAENLGQLTREIGAALDGRVEYELVYVDDGSDDSTLELVTRLGAENPRIRVVQHRVRAGQSAAIASGVKAARGEWIATLDGDGQNDPRDILPMFDLTVRQPAGSPIRLVTGYRRERQDSRSKRIAGRIANAVRRRVLGDGTPDTGCGLKLFQREAFLALPHFDHMHRYLPALFVRNGWQVTSVPVGHRARRHGRSHYGVWDRLRVGLLDLPGVWWLLRRPLRPAIVEKNDES